MNDSTNRDNNNTTRMPDFTNLGLINDASKISTNSENKQIGVKKKKYPIWLSVSEAAKLGGIQTKTIRRAIQGKLIDFKIIKNRYAIELESLIQFLNKNTKLKNKLNQNGLGQYVLKWK